MSRLAILGYHKVGPPAPGGWDTWYYVPAATLAAQLATVRACGWELIDADALRAAVRGEQDALPERAVLVTFDDGYENNLEHALPVLLEHACPAVLFVPTAHVGGTNAWDQDEEPAERICDWEALSALAAAGVSVQSHGVSHRSFSSLTDAERREELARSRIELEAHLPAPVDLFAFPYGDDADGAADVQAALRDAGYVAAFGYGGDPTEVPAADRFRLERVAMGPDTHLRAVLGAAA